MEIPLQAHVECADGFFGRSVCVLIDPVLDEVTHLVVRETSSPNTQYIVPVNIISATTADTIQLHCSKAEMEKMDPFVYTEFIEEKILAGAAGYGTGASGMGSYYMPYVTPEITVQVPVEHLQIPPGELAVRRGTRVEATDGYVGKVDEFVINQESGYITYLVMREGHLWGDKNVIIPLSAMGETRDDTVFLKINKHEIGSLPTFPVTRRWS
jgi:PRC-barrel domain